MVDTGVVCQKKKKQKIELVTFSLRVQMHTYPPAVALCLMSLVPQVYCPQNVEQPPVFLGPPPHPFVHRSGLFFSCFVLALTSNHLTRNE